MLPEEFQVLSPRRHAIVDHVEGNRGRGSGREIKLRLRKAVLYVYMDVLNAPLEYWWKNQRGIDSQISQILGFGRNESKRHFKC